jgi:hypothetical protein
MTPEPAGRFGPLIDELKAMIRPAFRVFVEDSPRPGRSPLAPAAAFAPAPAL